MSNYLEIEGKKYNYVSNYKNNQDLRISFNKLAQKTFGIDFEDYNAIVIANFEDNKLYLQDIFSTKEDNVSNGVSKGTTIYKIDENSLMIEHKGKNYCLTDKKEANLVNGMIIRLR